VSSTIYLQSYKELTISISFDRGGASPSPVVGNQDHQDAFSTGNVRSADINQIYEADMPCQRRCLPIAAPIPKYLVVPNSMARLPFSSCHRQNKNSRNLTSHTECPHILMSNILRSRSRSPHRPPSPPPCPPPPPPTPVRHIDEVAEDLESPPPSTAQELDQFAGGINWDDLILQMGQPIAGPAAGVAWRLRVAEKLREAATSRLHHICSWLYTVLDNSPDYRGREIVIHISQQQFQTDI
jgi:hypothetical protein